MNQYFALCKKEAQKVETKTLGTKVSSKYIPTPVMISQTGRKWVSIALQLFSSQGALL